MKENKNSKNKYIKNTICSLYEVEKFLCNYTKFSDIVSLIKIAKRQSKHKH